MRVISGEFRGRPLITPKNKCIRPTSDRGKEVIFNTLTSLLIKLNRSLNQMKIMDIFCGTGSLGIEAFSRGCKKIIFVDNSIESINLAAENCKKLNINNAEFLHSDYRELTSANCKVDMIFADPPYRTFNSNEILSYIIRKDLLYKNGLIIFESLNKDQIKCSDALKLLKIKNVSKSSFYFFLKQ